MEVPKKAPNMIDNMKTNQINLAAVTNALYLVDRLAQVRCLSLVKKYSFLKSGEKLLEECVLVKKFLKDDIASLKNAIHFSEIDSNESLEILKDKCDQEIKCIEDMKSVPNSYDEIFSGMNPDEVLLYYYLLAKYRILILAQMESVIMNKMGTQNQEMHELARKIDLSLSK